MFSWLRFIGEFLLERLTSIGDIFGIMVDGVGMLTTSFMAAPEFLYPILYLMLSIAVIMWVVNIL